MRFSHHLGIRRSPIAKLALNLLATEETCCCFLFASPFTKAFWRWNKVASYFNTLPEVAKVGLGRQLRTCWFLFHAVAHIRIPVGAATPLQRDAGTHGSHIMSVLQIFSERRQLLLCNLSIHMWGLISSMPICANSSWDFYRPPEKIFLRRTNRLKRTALQCQTRSLKLCMLDVTWSYLFGFKLCVFSNVCHCSVRCFFLMKLDGLTRNFYEEQLSSSAPTEPFCLSCTVQTNIPII